MKIKKFSSAEKDIVFSMMRVFYDSPAVFSNVSDEKLHHVIEDCFNPSVPLHGYGIYEDELLVGYGMVTFCYSTEFGGMCVWIEDLYLTPAARGKGYAGTFFHFVEEEFPDACLFKLEVEKENVHAIDVYKHMGYSIAPYFEMWKEK